MQAASHVRRRAVGHTGRGDEPVDRTDAIAKDQPPPRPRAQQPPNQGSLVFHPAYCYRASPTWFTWVKLTARDVHHRLKANAAYQVSSATGTANLNLDPTLESGAPNSTRKTEHARFDKTLLLFYLNHPIQFVQLVGVVVAVEEYFEKHWLFTIDDSSGETIEIRCPKPVKQSLPGGTTTSATLVSSVHVVSGYTLDRTAKSGNSGRGHNPDGEDADEYNANNSGNKSRLDQSSHEALDVGISPEERSKHDIVSKLSVGMVVQVKGRISLFRQIRQLQLERITVVRDTNHEVRLIAARTDFINQVLCRPWILTAAQQAKLLKEAQNDRDKTYEHAAKVKRRAKEKILREERHRLRILRRYQVEEEKRAAAALEAQRAGEMLKSQTAIHQ